MLIKNIGLAIIGLASGFAIAGGIFAFITWLGIINRLASKTRTADRIMIYEDMVVLGCCFGNLLYLYEFPVPLGIPGVIVFGLFSGIYAGCLSIALAEVIQSIPVFSRRAKIKFGAPYLVLGLALGKALGSIIQFFT